jgi:uncharacterized oxidoreductase
MPTISKSDLQSFAASLLYKAGFTKEEADVTARSLVLSNLMGYDSHGVVRVKEYIDCLKRGERQSGVDLKTLKESGNTIQADGQFGLGQVQMPRLLERLYAKVKDNGVVCGSIMNCGHAARLGEWVEDAARKGFAAFMAVNDNGAYRVVAAPGGKEARTSTNPLAFAIPLKGERYFSIDLSTSVVAAGKVNIARIAGKSVPEGWLLDCEGKPTTEPATLFCNTPGTILPFGGYKGFALAMIVDCLTAGLSGGFAPPAPEGTPDPNTVMITLWNPEYFAGLAHMQEQAEKYLDYVRASTPIDPSKPVRVPGDRAKSVHQERLEKGIPVEENLYAALACLAEKLNVETPPAF